MGLGVGAGYYIEDSYLVGMDSYNDGFEPDIHLALLRTLLP